MRDGCNAVAKSDRVLHEFTPKGQVLRPEYGIGAAKACVHSDACDVPSASGSFGVVQADAKLVRQHDEAIGDHLPCVVLGPRAAGFASEAVVCSEELLPRIACQPIGIQTLTEFGCGSIKLCFTDQLQQLHVADIPVCHDDAHVFEMVAQREHVDLVVNHDPARESLSELMAAESPRTG